MSEVNRMLDQYDRVMQGDAWHGDPVWTILEGVTPECAAYRSANKTHSIWELVMHMGYWETVAARRLANLDPQKSDDRNFPTVPEPTEANWSKALEDFRASNDGFRKSLAQLNDAVLDTAMPRDSSKSYYVESHGLIQHHIYHAGQIAILKKAFAAR